MDNFQALKGSPLKQIFTLVSLCLTILTLSLVCVENEAGRVASDHYVLFVAGSAMAGLAAIIGLFLDDNRAFTFNSLVGGALYGAAFISTAVASNANTTSQQT